MVITSKLVQGGKFRVLENGVIYKIKNGKETLATIVMTSRLKKYGVVTFTENSKQKPYYVHRLVAEAFCENPNNYPQVSHLDGNMSNNIPSNLKWCTAKQSTIHAYRTGLIDKAKYTEPCQVCGQPTGAKDGICSICKREILRQAKADSALSELREKLSVINPEFLNPKQAEIVSLRQEGKTLQEIGDKFQMTKQRVEQIIAGLVIRSISPIKESHLIEKERKRLLAKIAKKEDKINAALNIIEAIKKEISSLGDLLDGLPGIS